MGIDVYARWRKQTEAQREAQYTGFSVVSGNKGYLREAYHGGPYVTKYLMTEGFGSSDDMVKLYDTGEVVPYSSLTDDQKNSADHEILGVQIPAATLRERLPIAILIALYREVTVYGNGNKQPWLINIEEAMPSLEKCFESMHDESHKKAEKFATPEVIESAKVLIEKKLLPDFAQAFVDFVELCEQVEKENGEPCYIYVSA